MAIYEDESPKTNYWALWAGCCVIGGAFLGIAFAALFVHGPHWLTNLSAVALGYGGGALGARLYKRTAKC